MGEDEIVVTLRFTTVDERPIDESHRAWLSGFVQGVAYKAESVGLDCTPVVEGGGQVDETPL